jgi:CheY-like chemotaxis protein
MKTRALVIDDDATLLRLVATFLDSGGYEAHTATSGVEGIRLAQELTPDVILLDVHLPEMDGYEICRRLRADAALRRTAIIMLTASRDRHLNQEAYAAGAQACVPKPSGRESLLNIIETVRGGMPPEKEGGAG